MDVASAGEVVLLLCDVLHKSDDLRVETQRGVPYTKLLLFELDHAHKLIIDFFDLHSEILKVLAFVKLGRG